MPKYATIFDAQDPAITVEERHLLKAEVVVDAILRERGINPADVTLPQALLTDLAVNHACRISAIEGAIGSDSPLISKAREYEKSAQILANAISRESLGMTVPSGAGFGSVVMGRG